ncbi:ATP-grasp fold amidoligase family protein [Xanthomonas fragariae]|uniref:ATP-grasp fold amidoligase family protein n=1 Tax=Xanthomonas fragariae TaxID=48664 RepID=UPI001EDCED19|nr:ATP-grasp fold amidoligase family protein [Xanthomonas fragariae]
MIDDTLDMVARPPVGSLDVGRLLASLPAPSLACATRHAAGLPPPYAVVVSAPTLRRLLRKGVRRLVRTLPWRHQDRIYYFNTFGRFPNLYNPTCFNEKVLYRKCVHGDYPVYQRLADKVAVRPYVASRIGNAHLIPLLLDSNNPEDLLSLPRWRQTVIKANHGASMVEIVRDEPDAVQRRRIIERCGQWLRHDFSDMEREIHYRNIPPRILVEHYIGDAQHAPVDYKFHMFRQADGSFHYVLQVIYGRFDTPALSMTFFVDNLHEAFHRIRDDGRQPPCAPQLLEQALELSKVLASDFDYVRVDWYIQNGQIYFGELTFTPGAGLVTGLGRGLDRIMGDMWVQRRAPVEPCFATARRS